MKSFNEKNLEKTRLTFKPTKPTKIIHTTVKIFTVGHGLLPNRHLPRLSTNVKRYGAHTEINNIHTQRSR